MCMVWDSSKEQTRLRMQGTDQHLCTHRMLQPRDRDEVTAADILSQLQDLQLGRGRSPEAKQNAASGASVLVPTIPITC